jgi:hypothetical protein
LIRGETGGIPPRSCKATDDHLQKIKSHSIDKTTVLDIENCFCK